MSKNVLLVGCKYTGEEIPDTKFSVLGLCRPEIRDDKAAYALYEYDIVIINPESYSHFLFGEESEHSQSGRELWELKAENNNYDLDTAFDYRARSIELTNAIEHGTLVIWLLAPPKRTKFFGLRDIYIGYANYTPEKIISSADLQHKKSRSVIIQPEAGAFTPYFERLEIDGWRLCLSRYGDEFKSFAESPEGCSLGGTVRIGNSLGWILTPPTTPLATNVLIRCALGVSASEEIKCPYDGIFLSHTSADKFFVRQLKERLEAHGVKDVWLDEAEIQIGDSLTRKIEEGLKKTKYIGVVLSPRSIKSPWVERELEIAINREMSSGEVVILPLLYEKCELPSFLRGKMYADFTSHAEYDESLAKLLRRLKSS